jgi:hypothetical protein
LTYGNLSDDEKEAFSPYIKDNKLIVTNRISFANERVVQKYYGASLQIPKFYEIRYEVYPFSLTLRGILLTLTLIQVTITQIVTSIPNEKIIFLPVSACGYTVVCPVVARNEKKGG